MWQTEGTVGTVNADVSIKIILKMLHQHSHQLPHQHLNLKRSEERRVGKEC